MQRFKFLKKKSNKLIFDCAKWENFIFNEFKKCKTLGQIDSIKMLMEIGIDEVYEKINDNKQTKGSN